MVDQTVRDDSIEFTIAVRQTRSVCLLHADSAGKSHRLDLTGGTVEQGRRSIDGGDEDVATLPANVDGNSGDPSAHVKNATGLQGQFFCRIDERQK